MSEFGWSMATVQGGTAALAITMLISLPVVGMIADRIGVRMVAYVSTPLLGLTMMSFSLMTGSVAQFYAQCMAVAVFGAGTTLVIWTRAVNRYFDKQRGLVLGLIMSGTGLFSLLAKPSLAAVVANDGWRIAYLWLGAVPLLLMLPIFWGLIRQNPQEIEANSNPDGSHHTAGGLPGAAGLSLKEAVFHWRFWLLLLAFVPAAFATAGPIPNLERFLLLHDFDMAKATSITALLGIAIIVGRLGTGWLMDRIWAPAVGAILFLLPAAALLMLTQDTIGTPQAVVAVILIGLGAGAEFDILAFLVARYFGMFRYSTIFGIFFACFTTVGGVAPSVFGWFYDQTGTYSTIFAFSAVALGVGAVALITLGRFPDFQAGETGEESSRGLEEGRGVLANGSST